ncbi:MAG: hypothetical protein Q7T29_07285 [Gallionella sp.]|nr:hypothetical protein [Gallionella sp.]
MAHQFALVQNERSLLDFLMRMAKMPPPMMKHGIPVSLTQAIDETPGVIPQAASTGT